MASLDDTNSTKRVEDDRSQAIEAAVVRIMKVKQGIRTYIHTFPIYCAYRVLELSLLVRKKTHRIYHMHYMTYYHRATIF